MMTDDQMDAIEDRVALELALALNAKARGINPECDDAASAAAIVMAAAIRAAASFTVAIHHAAGSTPGCEEYVACFAAAFDRAVDEARRLPPHVQATGGLQ
jgi:hypothetical protein